MPVLRLRFMARSYQAFYQFVGKYHAAVNAAGASKSHHNILLLARELPRPLDIGLKNLPILVRPKHRTLHNFVGSTAPLGRWSCGLEMRLRKSMRMSASGYGSPYLKPNEMILKFAMTLSRSSNVEIALADHSERHEVRRG